ncbi:MAG: hypothetical protein KJ927_19930, partial [Candidatus Eisenbacteria bacterium]|nr:hypothetical protein [Candidatus Eisenbacteria bacterium]
MTDDRKNNSRGGKPGHRRWLRWLPVGLLAGLFFCFIAPFILVRFETPRNWMLDNGPGNWLLGAGTRLRVGNVHRLDPGGASFSGIVLSCKDSLGDWSDWARISHLNTSWDISDLIWGRYSIDRLELDSVSVNLQRSCVPHWHAEAGVVDELADPGPGRARSVRCSHFGLQHLSLLREGMPVGESRMELNSIQLEKGDLRLDVDSIRVLLAAGALRPSSAEMALNFSGGDLRYESKGTLRLDHLDVRSAGLEGQLWLRQSRGSEWFVTMQLEKILPAEMMDSLRLQVPDPYSPGTSDTLTGSINLTFVPDTLALHGELQGFWGGGPADIAGLVQRTPEGWQAEEIHLKRPGADLIFSGRADSEFAHIDGDVTFQKTNLNGPDFPWRASPIGRTNLAGSTQFVYRRPKNEIWEIIYSLRLGPSAIGNQRLDGLQARGLVTSSFVQADTFLIDLDEGRLTGGGRFDLQDGVMNAAIRLENVPAPAITDPFLDAPVEGRLFGRLQMQKTGEAMRIYGSLDGRDINWGELAASEIRLPWVDYTIPGNHLDGRVRLSGFHAGAFAADSVWLEIQDLEMGILVRGGTRFSDQAVSIVGILDPAPEGGLQIENFEWRPPEGAAWDAEKPFFIGWGSRGVSIDGLSLISPAGDLSFDGLWGAENNVEGRFSLHGDFLPLLSSWGLRPEATGGEINCDASLSGYWPNPGMSVRFQSDSLALWNWPLNDFTGALDWREGAIDLRRLQ